MPEARAAEVMITVHELAANAVRHGAGAGRARPGAPAGQPGSRVAWHELPAGVAAGVGGWDWVRRAARGRAYWHGS